MSTEVPSVQSTPRPASRTSFHWGWWLGIGLFAIIAFTGSAVVSANWVKTYIDTRVAAIASELRGMYERDTAAGRSAVAAAVNSTNSSLAAAQAEIERLKELNKEQADTIDRNLRTAVSPAVIKKLADEVTALKAAQEKLQASVATAGTDNDAAKKDVAQLSDYLSSQLYPAVAALQRQVQAQGEQTATLAQRLPSPTVPIGVLVPPAANGADRALTLPEGGRPSVR